MNDDHSPIDLELLTDLMGETGRDVFSAVLQGFHGVARESYDEVAASVRNADTAALAAAAHGAKGEARTAGATRLGELYSEIEAQAKVGDVKAATATVADAGAELGRVEVFIKTYAAQAS